MSATDLTTRREKLSAAKRALLEKRLTGRDTENQTIPRRQVRSHAPLSFAQQRLWFLHQLEPESIAYNMPTALRLTGRLNTGALEWTIHEIIRRHESLRTTFRFVDNEPVQVIAEQLTLEIPVVDLQTSEEREVMRLATEEAQRPFDLETGPLVRARLLKLSAEEWVLIFTMHDSGSLAKAVRKAGAKGCVLKSRASRDLIRAIEALLDGGTFWGPGLGAKAEDSKPSEGSNFLFLRGLQRTRQAQLAASLC